MSISLLLEMAQGSAVMAEERQPHQAARMAPAAQMVQGGAVMAEERQPRQAARMAPATGMALACVGRAWRDGRLC